MVLTDHLLPEVRARRDAIREEAIVAGTQPNLRCVLVWDGHSTHTNADILALLEQAGVETFTSRYTQPLHSGPFPQFKRELNEACRLLRFAIETDDDVDQEQSLLNAIGEATEVAFCAKHIRQGWRKTGLYPVRTNASFKLADRESSVQDPSEPREEDRTQLPEAGVDPEPDAASITAERPETRARQPTAAKKRVAGKKKLK
jgi:hypothetical protein